MKIFIPPNSPFLTTDTRTKRWAIPYHPECVNGRIDVLLERNSNALAGKSVVDVGSHIVDLMARIIYLGSEI